MAAPNRYYAEMSQPDREELATRFFDYLKGSPGMESLTQGRVVVYYSLKMEKGRTDHYTDSERLALDMLANRYRIKFGRPPSTPPPTNGSADHAEPPPSVPPESPPPSDPVLPIDDGLVEDPDAPAPADSEVPPPSPPPAPSPPSDPLSVEALSRELLGAERNIPSIRSPRAVPSPPEVTPEIVPFLPPPAPDVAPNPPAEPWDSPFALEPAPEAPPSPPPSAPAPPPAPEDHPDSEPLADDEDDPDSRPKGHPIHVHSSSWKEAQELLEAEERAAMTSHLRSDRIARKTIDFLRESLDLANGAIAEHGRALKIERERAFELERMLATSRRPVVRSSDSGEVAGASASYPVRLHRAGSPSSAPPYWIDAVWQAPIGAFFVLLLVGFMTSPSLLYDSATPTSIYLSLAILAGVVAIVALVVVMATYWKITKTGAPA